MSQADFCHSNPSLDHFPSNTALGAGAQLLLQLWAGEDSQSDTGTEDPEVLYVHNANEGDFGALWIQGANPCVLRLPGIRAVATLSTLQVEFFDGAVPSVCWRNLQSATFPHGREKIRKRKGLRTFPRHFLAEQTFPSQSCQLLFETFPRLCIPKIHKQGTRRI